MLTASHSYSVTHLRTFTGALRVFSATQKCGGVKVPEANPQLVWMGAGGWMPPTSNSMCEYSETNLHGFSEGSQQDESQLPTEVTHSLTQPALAFFLPWLTFPVLSRLFLGITSLKKLCAPKSLSWGLIWGEPNLKYGLNYALHWY